MLFFPCGKSLQVFLCSQLCVPRLSPSCRFSPDLYVASFASLKPSFSSVVFCVHWSLFVLKHSCHTICCCSYLYIYFCSIFCCDNIYNLINLICYFHFIPFNTRKFWTIISFGLFPNATEQVHPIVTLFLHHQSLRSVPCVGDFHHRGKIHSCLLPTPQHRITQPVLHPRFHVLALR